MPIASELDLSKNTEKTLVRALGLSVTGTVAYLLIFPDVDLSLAASLGFAAGSTCALVYYFMTRDDRPYVAIKNVSAPPKRVDASVAMAYLRAHPTAKIRTQRCHATQNLPIFQVDVYDVEYNLESAQPFVAQMSAIQLQIIRPDIKL